MSDSSCLGGFALGRIHQVDVLAGLSRLPAGSVQCIVTSPPYYLLRDYAEPGQWGLESSPFEYIAHMREFGRAARRVLRSDGTLWLNLGDTYAGSRCGGDNGPSGLQGGRSTQEQSRAAKRLHRSRRRDRAACPRSDPRTPGFKPKDLLGMPWRVAMALQEDGWYLRSEIIWHKPNPMPESVRDRPTRCHETIFLLSKSPRYYYNAAAIAEPVVYGDHHRNGCPGPDVRAPGQPRQSGITRRRRSGNSDCNAQWERIGGKRNKRSVWTIPTTPYRGAHYAVFPPALVEHCILAGCPPGGGGSRPLRRRGHYRGSGRASRPLLPGLRPGRRRQGTGRAHGESANRGCEVRPCIGSRRGGRSDRQVARRSLGRT